MGVSEFILRDLMNPHLADERGTPLIQVLRERNGYHVSMDLIFCREKYLSQKGAEELVPIVKEHKRHNGEAFIGIFTCIRPIKDSSDPMVIADSFLRIAQESSNFSSERIDFEIPREILRNQWTEYMRSQEWTQKKREAFELAEYKCQRCGREAGTRSRKYIFKINTPVWDKDTIIYGIEVHHLNYDRLGHENMEDLEVLCYPCHRKADTERRAASHA